MSAVPARVRKAIVARDGEACVVASSAWCAVWPCAGVLTVQHRRGRGMGGAKGAHELENLVLMCAYHNQLETASAVFHRVCLEHGWSVPRWNGSVEVSSVPVWNGGWWLLSGADRSALDVVECEARMREVYGDWGREGIPTHR